VFNIQGSELVFLLLIALIVLGPEKLPDAVRKFGRAYAEFKKMANGFQGELRDALDEPMRELRDTADLMRKATNFDSNESTPTPDAPAPAPPKAPIKREQGLNFGSANPRRPVSEPRTVEPAESLPAESLPAESLPAESLPAESLPVEDPAE
jgi:sec-independent protein translocase protein TatB